MTNATPKLKIPKPIRESEFCIMAAETVSESYRPEFLMIMSALGIEPQTYESAKALAKAEGNDDDDDYEVDEVPRKRSGRSKTKPLPPATGGATLGDILQQALNSQGAAVPPTTSDTSYAALRTDVDALKAEAPSKWYPVYRFRRNVVNLNYSFSELRQASFIKSCMEDDMYHIHTTSHFLRATTIAEIGEDVEELYKLSVKLFDDTRSLNISRQSYLTKLVFTSVVVAGVHFDKTGAKLPNGWKIISASAIDDGVNDDVLHVYEKHRHLYFAGRRTPKQIKELFANIILNSVVSSTEFATLWAGETLKGVVAELSGTTARRRDLERRLQAEIINESRLKKMLNLLETGGSAWVTNMVTQLEASGFDSARFVAAGIIMTTGDVFINVGDHQTEANNRYIGKFEVLFGVGKSISIRNIASPRKEINHPIFDEDDCLGGFGDIISKCFKSDDYLTLGMSILAMISHFSPAHLDSFKSWPTRKPEKTYICTMQTLYGELSSYDNDRPDRNDDDQDEE